MRALSIRQPYAELILRGIKRIEYRSMPTHIVGERFYIYAAGKKWDGHSSPVTGRSSGKKAWSGDLATGDDAPPWIVELANGLRMFPHELPTGVIVGSAVIEKVVGPVESPTHQSSLINHHCFYAWHLTDVERAKKFRKPTGHPQPVWFKPFGV